MSYDKAAYYEKLTKIFAAFPDDGTKRAYVSAVVKCFDLNEGAPHDPQQIARDHAFPKGKLHELGFVLAKAHATEFLVGSARLPGLTAKDIRDINISRCQDRFGRTPFIRGRSSYWLSLAEWICVLEVRGEFTLPRDLHDYAVSHRIV